MTVTVSAPSGARPPALARAGHLVLPALRSAVAHLDDTSRSQVSYHLGWTDLDGNAVPGAGGKGIRPTLAVLSALAGGGPAEQGVPGAVAVELVHNFSLLHDDLMDGDTERRHRRTVWAVWGAPSAILAGDALLALAQEVLLDAASPHRGDAARLLAQATRALVRGQVLDLAFERRDDVTVAECLDMAAGKTGALLSASAAIGAVLAGAPASVVDALRTFGAELGLAFQLVDDVLGIWGDPAVTGKPVFSDLRARKKSLPVAHVLAGGGVAGRELAAWLADRGDADEASQRRIAELVEAAGGREWASAEATRRLAVAERALDPARLTPGPLGELVAVARYVVAREV